MNKKFIYVFILLTILFTSICYAHPGRTDSNGGHYDRNTGEYHYHNGEYAGQTQYSSNDNNTKKEINAKIKNIINSNKIENTNNNDEHDYTLLNWCIGILIGLPVANKIYEKFTEEK